MGNLAFSLRELAPLCADYDRYPHPWHDAESGCNAVTNGKAVLLWAGKSYSTDPLKPLWQHGPPDLSVLTSPDEKPLGQCAASDLYNWAQTVGQQHLEGTLPAKLFGRVLDAGLLRTYLRPVLPRWSGSGTVHISSDPNPLYPIHIAADVWKIVIMPVRLPQWFAPLKAVFPEERHG